MRKVLALAVREYLAAVRTKGFIIGLVLAPILMGGGFIGMALFKDQVDTTDQKLAVIDHSGLLGPALVQAAQARNAKEIRHPTTGKKLKPAYLIELVVARDPNADAQRLELSNQVRAKALHAFLEIGADVLHPQPGSKTASVYYYARNGALDDLRRWIATPINDELRRCRLREAGVDLAQVRQMFDWLPIESMGLVARDEQTGAVTPPQRRSEAEAVLLPLSFQVLMFMLFMMGAAPLLQSVMEEKNQRIAEVVLGSVTPFQFMFGKLIGGVAVSLTGSAVYVLGGILTLHSQGLASAIPLPILPWFFAYLLTALFLYGSAFAALGSACSDAKDAHSLQLPGMLPLLIPMFLIGPLLKEPHSTMATALSLFPLFTPTVMLLRLCTPAGVPAWQPWVGFAGVLLCTVLSVWLGGRIFRVGILLQGKPPRLSELVRWALRG